MRSDSYIWYEGQGRSPRSVANSAQKRSANRSSTWQSLGHQLMSYFSGSSEPQIRQRTYGDQLVWHVYDPTTRQEWQFYSEKEVRVWLEQRYYAG